MLLQKYTAKSLFPDTHRNPDSEGESSERDESADDSQLTQKGEVCLEWPLLNELDRLQLQVLPVTLIILQQSLYQLKGK